METKQTGARTPDSGGFPGEKKHLQTNVGASTEFIMELIVG